MSEFAFYMDVLHALEAVGAAYMVVGGFSSSPFDIDYVTARAAQIGADALALWMELLARAQRQAPDERSAV